MQNRKVVIAYIDFTRAFDSVSHVKLLLLLCKSTPVSAGILGAPAFIHELI